MSCNNEKSSRRKIILLSSIALGIALVSYLIFTTTNNPAMAATILTFLPFAACPSMCIAMGGAMWVSNRVIKNQRNKKNYQDERSKENEKSCCSDTTNERNKHEEKQVMTNPHVSEIKYKENVVDMLQSKKQKRE
ncbi:MAG: hypothetical protein M3Z01_09860 [Thermoproteota archaeon]|nr:hypothetical protein [Thermoproteota archaeon]